MTKRIAVSNLNATTIDIINTIRANASAEFQQYVPQITTELDIPKVGEAIFGYPGLANQFLSALINRIALVAIKSATFNNDYAELKKGYLEFGETVEEVFVQIAKAREFSAEKAAQREFKRTLPDVRSAFHVMNYRAQYPITVTDEELRMAFISAQGVQDLVAKIIQSVQTGANYDEYLLFKYLIIKAVNAGKMYPIAVDATNLTDSAKKFRGMSNQLQFMSNKYNASGVHTTTPKEDQYIFMDAQFNADYDVDVLASAFNMDKVTFMGHLKLVDSFDTFDNDRFSQIREGSTQIEEVTDAELQVMSGVKAVLVDREWFQVYDNLERMTEVFVSSGLYYNYNLNVWKTVSSSPFSNAIVFADGDLNTAPATIEATVTAVDTSDVATIYSLATPVPVQFVQTEDATKSGIAVHKYGAIMIPAGNGNSYNVESTYRGATYVGGEVNKDAVVGTKFTMTNQ